MGQAGYGSIYLRLFNNINSDMLTYFVYFFGSTKILGLVYAWQVLHSVGYIVS